MFGSTTLAFVEGVSALSVHFLLLKQLVQVRAQLQYKKCTVAGTLIIIGSSWLAYLPLCEV